MSGRRAANRTCRTYILPPAALVCRNSDRTFPYFPLRTNRSNRSPPAALVRRNPYRTFRHCCRDRKSKSSLVLLNSGRLVSFERFCSDPFGKARRQTRRLRSVPYSYRKSRPLHPYRPCLTPRLSSLRPDRRQALPPQCSNLLSLRFLPTRSAFCAGPRESKRC